MPKQVFFVRHGQSQANLDRVLAGQSDSPLTELGKQQATEAGREINDLGLKIDLIISSPICRALDTAELTAKAIGYPLEDILQLEALKERDAGAFVGQPFASLYQATESQLVKAGAETGQELAVRVRAVNREINSRQEKVILLVGHSGFYKMATVLGQGLTPEHITEVETLPNASLLPYPSSVVV